MKTVTKLPITINGKRKSLPLLHDDESDLVDDLFRAMRKDPDQCPTCNDKRLDGNSAGRQETDNPLHWGEINGQYRFRGEIHECDCRGQKALYRHYVWANLPEQYMRLDWADYDGDQGIKNQVYMYIEKWKNFKMHGMGACLFGQSLGIGKTFAATSIAKAILQKGCLVYFMSFKHLMSAYQLPPEEGWQLDRRMKNSELLVLDEILPPTSQAQEAFFADKLEMLIRHRTNWNLPTILTTNLESEMETYYPRVGSLLAPKQWPIHMTGNDQRRNRIAEENLELVLNGEVRPLV